MSNSLFHNRGDGTFEEFAARAGAADATGRGLGVRWVDMDNDGFPDLYVSNAVSDNVVSRHRAPLRHAPQFHAFAALRAHPRDPPAQRGSADTFAVARLQHALDRGFAEGHRAERCTQPRMTAMI